MRGKWIVAGFLVLIIGGLLTRMAGSQTEVTPTTVLPSATPFATSTPGPTPTPLLPTPTPSQTPTATPTPLHPLAIDWLRQRSYDGGEIVIEDVLAYGVNYYRYYASYQSDGLKIYGLLTLPFGETPETGWPVIVFNHGYIPPDQYKTTERYIDYLDVFAQRGYIVFRSDYRGHDNSEGVARGAYGYPDYVVDVLNAVDALKNYADADPNRIGMWGHSMGGYITLRAMVVSPDIKAGVIWAGVVASYPDLIASWERRTGPTRMPRLSSWRDPLNATWGTPEENPEFWNSLSANSYLADLSGPVQLHHGSGDTNVPFEFSSNLYQQILDAGKYTEYYEHSGDDHNIAINFAAAMLRSIQFFDKFLKGE